MHGRDSDGAEPLVFDSTEPGMNDNLPSESLDTGVSYGSDGTPRVAIIGSGFGGLSLAVRLQSAGYRTVILERREKIGGRAYQWTEGGYTFDMGPSLVTAPSIIRSIFDAAGERLEDHVDLVPLDPFYRIFFHDGTHVDYSGDAERMKEQMRRFDAADAERYDDFIRATQRIHEAVIGDGLGRVPFDTLGRMASFIPRAIRLNALMPVAWFARRYFRDFRHHFMFSFHSLFIGGHPYRTPSIYALIPYLEKNEGVWFARGGMYSIVEALGRVFERLGGEIRTGSEVTQIRIEHGRAVGVETRSGFVHADAVVSNADVSATYRHLIDPAERSTWTDGKIDGLSQTMSCFLLYIGTRKKYPKLAHHTLILAERYKGLIDDIFAHQTLPEDFSMYLHVPTATDPDMAPDGCESMYVLVPVPNLNADVDWSVSARPYADRILDFLEKWGLEGLRESIEVLRIFTPEDFRTELGAFAGNAFSVEPTLLQTAWFRPHNRSEDVRGLYLVGAGTHPGAGVPGVMLSAEATMSCIADDLPDPSTRRRVVEHSNGRG